MWYVGYSYEFANIRIATALRFFNFVAVPSIGRTYLDTVNSNKDLEEDQN
jgi:hypothetical protein